MLTHTPSSTIYTLSLHDALPISRGSAGPAEAVGLDAADGSAQHRSEGGVLGRPAVQGRGPAAHRYERKRVGRTFSGPPAWKSHLPRWSSRGAPGASIRRARPSLTARSASPTSASSTAA